MDTLCKLNSAERYGVKELKVLLELSSLPSNKEMIPQIVESDDFLNLTLAPTTINGTDVLFICTPIRCKDQIIGTLDTILGKIEKQIIMDALIASKGNSAKAAEHLGITERKMGLRIKKYKIELHRFKTKAQ